MMEVREKIEEINRLLSEVHAFRVANPISKCGYHKSPSGILNAYREGDLSFDEAVAELGTSKIVAGLLCAIASLGGNLTDARLTDRTGPNDAAHRGMLYCESRRMALLALEALGEEW